MTGESVGYVVVVWNQAGGGPSVLDGSFSLDPPWAYEVASQERRRDAKTGRRERYAVAEVVLTEDPR